MLEEFGTLMGAGDVTCWRPVWREHDKCIWHADVDKKPADELANARTGLPERLDYSKLRKVDVTDDLSFSGCNLRNSDMSQSDFKHVDFSRANLSMAELNGTDVARADFSDAELSSAKLIDSKVIRANFDQADMSYANFSKANAAKSSFCDAYLRRGIFKDSYLSEADFAGANLTDAEFGEARAKDAIFVGANLEEANLVRTDLRGADLTDSRLYNAYFSDIRMNTATKFGSVSPYDGFGKLEDWDSSHTEASVWTYRRLQSLHEEHSQNHKAREYHIKRSEAQKRLYRNKGEWFNYIVSVFNGAITEYGENPWRVIQTSLATILIWSILYYFLGRIHITNIPERGALIGFGLFPNGIAPSWLSEFLLSVYFSAVTFSTLGLGDAQPASDLTLALTAVESFLGVLLMSLLVFVLGRQTRM
jgi:uncharacterized protein YjbI with pentapeptide repeats